MAIKKLVVGIFVLALVGVFFFLSSLNFTGKVVSGDDKMESFVDCLNDHNFTLYGYKESFDVTAQLSLFGSQSSKVNFVDCTQYPDKCIGMFVFPVWEFEGKRVAGAFSLGVLSGLSGCEI